MAESVALPVATVPPAPVAPPAALKIFPPSPIAKVENGLSGTFKESDAYLALAQASASGYPSIRYSTILF
jgi:hypothetical protein